MNLSTELSGVRFVILFCCWSTLLYCGCDKLLVTEEPSRPLQSSRVTVDEEEPAPTQLPTPDPVAPAPVILPDPMPQTIRKPEIGWVAKSYREFQERNARGLYFDLKYNVIANPDQVAIRIVLADGAGNTLTFEPNRVGNLHGIEQFVPGASNRFAPYKVSLQYFDRDRDEWLDFTGFATI